MTPKELVNKFLDDTSESRIIAERCRDYFDHKQWTAAEEAELNSRNQAPIVVNRVKAKVEGLIGLYNLRQTDPKAYPRTKKHEKSSLAVTDALRYVADNTRFADTKLDCAGDFFVEGATGAIVDVKEKKNGEVEINISQIPWDRLIYSSTSRAKDFSDSRINGMFIWMEKDQIKELFPNADIDAIMAEKDHVDETTEDRPRWVDSKKNRARVVQLFHIERAVWKMSIFAGDYFLVKTQDSPFLDDEGEPVSPIELVSANVDRNNARYGEVLGFLSQQDEINHRRSKFLFLLNNRQTWATPGAVKDVVKLKRELRKADGHIEINGVINQDWGVLEQPGAENGQFLMYQDAKAELDAVSFNAQLAGERQQGDLSGVAIDKLQQAGTMELNRQYNLLSGFEKRIYIQVWARIKQFWNGEKWIRVTDDQDNLRWAGLNAKVTTQEFLQEKINDDSIDIQDRQRFAASFQFLMSALQNPQTAEQAQTKLKEIIEIKNDTDELDVDIIIDQSFDVINIQQEQFQLLAQFAQGTDIDIIELIELSGIRGKEELIEKIETRRSAQSEAAGNIAEKEAQSLDVKNAQGFERAKLDAARTRQTQVETELMIQNPDQDPQVIT